MGYKANCSKKVTKSIYTQSVATQKCGAFIEYIIKRHIVAINDTKVWHIPTNSNKYKVNCSKYSAKSNNYSAKSNKYSAMTYITTCLQTGYFNYVVYFYIFTATSN